MTRIGDSQGAVGRVMAAVTGTGKGWRSARALTLSISLVGVLLLALGAIGCGSDEQAGTSAGVVDTGGKLQLTETYFDAGSVPVEQKVEHSFTIKNTGTGPLNMGQMSVKRLEGC
ncbi:MAG: hypothetical protein Q7K29_01935 [Thermoleophilia bacterium]|nr:hypothetical protein [Thermoleophilia bacterium]